MGHCELIIMWTIFNKLILKLNIFPFWLEQVVKKIHNQSSNTITWIIVRRKYTILWRKYMLISWNYVISSLHNLVILKNSIWLKLNLSVKLLILYKIWRSMLSIVMKMFSKLLPFNLKIWMFISGHFLSPM